MVRVDVPDGSVVVIVIVEVLQLLLRDVRELPGGWQGKAHPAKSDLSGSSAVRLGLEIKWLVQYLLQMAFNFCMRGYHDVYSAQERTGHLGWSRCRGEAERSVVVLSVLLVEVQPHQAGVVVVSIHLLLLHINGSKMCK